MKRSIAAGACLALMGSLAMAGGEGWSSDFEAAKKQAAEGKMDLLIDFTGSDWCGWCIKLVDEVFSKDAFKSGVKGKFVLVELDFPRDEAKLDDKTKAQNAKLQEQFGIQGFPTIVLADAEGRPYASTGYQEGGPEKYVGHLDELRKKRGVRDEALAKAGKAEGVEKAEALLAALDGLSDEMIAGCYGGVIEQIKAADPDDKTGFAKRAGQKAAMAEIEEKIGEFFQKEDLDGALAYVDKAVAEKGLEGETKQQAMAMKIILRANQGKFDEALKTLEEVKAIAPDSELAGQLDGFRGRLEEAKAEKEKKGAGEPEMPAEKAAEKPADKAAE